MYYMILLFNCNPILADRHLLNTLNQQISNIKSNSITLQPHSPQPHNPTTLLLLAFFNGMIAIDKFLDLSTVFPQGFIHPTTIATVSIEVNQGFSCIGQH